MLDLDHPAWIELKHAYGAADDIPSLLARLEANETWVNEDYGQDEPWFSLWSALCHQGDVYTASYASVPHLIRIATRSDAEIRFDFFLLPASIEIARQTGRGPAVPPQLAEAYFAALQQLHELAYRLARTPWDQTLGRAIAAALLVIKGHPGYAEMILDFTPEEVEALRRREDKQA